MKRVARHLLLGSCVFLASRGARAQTSDRWLQFDIGHGHASSVDTMTIASEPPTVFRVWIKTVFDTPRSVGGAHPGSYSSWLIHYRIDCKALTLSSGPATFYDSSGSTVANVDAPFGAFDDPVPESIGESIVFRVCAFIARRPS